MGKITLIMHFRRELSRYKDALHFLDTCGELTKEKIAKARSMAFGYDDDIFNLDGEMKKLFLQTHKNEQNPEKSYLKENAELTRKLIMKLIVDPVLSG